MAALTSFSQFSISFQVKHRSSGHANIGKKGMHLYGHHADGKTDSGLRFAAAAELLQLLGIDFEVIPSHMDETSRNDETPPEHVQRLSSEKAEMIAALFPEALVLGADTVVVIAGRMLGKPGNPGEARDMLKRLSGREHIVYTGFSLIQKKKGRRITQVVRSAVLFKEIPEDEISWYVSSEEPYDKPGGMPSRAWGRSSSGKSEDPIPT
jgi:septum formation protein